MEIDYLTNVPFKIEGWLKIIFIATTLLYLPVRYYNFFQFVLAFVICYCGIRRSIKAFPIALSTLKEIALNEFGICLLYIVLLASVNEPSMVFFLPIDLYFLIGVAEFIIRAKPAFLSKIETVNAGAKIIQTNKNLIKVSRTFCEVFLFFYSILMTILGKMSFLVPLVAFNYIRLKSASPFGRWAMLEMQKTVVARVQRFGWAVRGIEMFFNLFTKY
jgi:hypothetical protein